MPEEKNDKDLLQEEDNAENAMNDSNNNEYAEDAEEIQHEIESLRQEAEENRDKLLRLAAEFENYKKRMERERASMLKYAGENILRDLLPVLDNLERAIEQASLDAEDSDKKLEGLVAGVEMTRDGLLSTLEKFEVFPLESVGKEFDPNEHEAMAMESSDQVPANHVLNEYVKGYRFKDRLLRAAKVIVSQGAK